MDNQPLDLSLPKKTEEVIHIDQKQEIDHIIKIFSSNISNSTATAGPSSAPAPVRRLKHHTKGEDLTNADVVARLEEAELKRGNKRSANGKPGRPKIQKT